MRNLGVWRLLLAAVLLCAGPVFAQTLGYSEWKPGSPPGTAVTTTGGTTQATGSTFVVVAVYRNTGGSGAAPTSVTDSKSNTYTQGSNVTYAFGFANIAIYYCINCTGGASHTATATWGTSTTDFFSVAFVEIKSVGAGTLGSHPTGVTDGTGTQTITAPSITTAVANEIVVEAFGTYSSNTSTINTTGTGFTQIVSQAAATATNGAISWAVPASSGTAAAATFSHTGTNDYAGALSISIKPPGAGGCTHNFWKSTGAFAQPDGTTGSYWSSAGAFATPNCTSGSYWRQDGTFNSN